jgi:aspartate/methionine/tyrosine aminotransferase
MYAERLDCLQQILTECGMELAVEPQAGFFILCNSPRVAFGQGIADAEAFNDLMISKTGVVGVPFGSYIRYAVCTTDIAALRDEITAAFSRAKVAY